MYGFLISGFIFHNALMPWFVMYEIIIYGFVMSWNYHLYTCNVQICRVYNCICIFVMCGFIMYGIHCKLVCLSSVSEWNIKQTSFIPNMGYTTQITYQSCFTAQTSGRALSTQYLYLYSYDGDYCLSKSLSICVWKNCWIVVFQHLFHC
jgi:hypothetical protein